MLSIWYGMGARLVHVLNQHRLFFLLGAIKKTYPKPECWSEPSMPYGHMRLPIPVIVGSYHLDKKKISIYMIMSFVTASYISLNA